MQVRFLCCLLAIEVVEVMVIAAEHLRVRYVDCYYIVNDVTHVEWLFILNEE